MLIFMVLQFIFYIVQFSATAAILWLISKILKNKFEDSSLFRSIRVAFLVQIIAVLLRILPIIIVGFMFSGPLRGALFFVYAEYYAIYFFLFILFIQVILMKKIYRKKFNEKISFKYVISGIIISEITYIILSSVISEILKFLF